MQPRVSSIFGSYDLFAKAFPGIVFFSLAVSLLPVPDVSQEIQSNGILLAVIALSVIIFGFVSGQALHAIAVRIESIALRGAESYILYRKTAIVLVKSMYTQTKLQMLRLIYSVVSDENDTPKDDDADDKEDIPKNEYISTIEDTSEKEYEDTVQFFKDWLSLFIMAVISLSPVFFVGFYVWVGELGAAVFTILFVLFPPQNAKDWLKETLYPHRELFNDKISKDEQPVKKFKKHINQLFDIQAEESSNFAYKIVMSYYERITVGRTRQFQATFSFCRSMWVTLLLFSTIFLLISSPTLSEVLPIIEYNTVSNWSYTPIIELLLPSQSILNMVGFVMFLSVFLFMEGERQNKRLFVEYIFVDLVTISEEQLPEDIQSES